MPDAVVLAGGPPDPAIAGAMVPKAFALLAGRPMVDYVLDALRGAGPIGRVLLVGPDPLPVRLAGGVDALVAERGSLLENVAAGLEATGGGGAVLVVAADLPLLTPQAVAAFLEAAGRIEGEAWYAVVRREDVTGPSPTSGRPSCGCARGRSRGGAWSSSGLRPSAGPGLPSSGRCGRASAPGTSPVSSGRARCSGSSRAA